MLLLETDRPVNYDVYHRRPRRTSSPTATQRQQRARQYARLLEEHAAKVVLGSSDANL